VHWSPCSDQVEKETFQVHPQVCLREKYTDKKAFNIAGLRAESFHRVPMLLTTGQNVLALHLPFAVTVFHWLTPIFCVF
jgi:hypothetical protein